MKNICPQCGAPLSRINKDWICSYCGYTQVIEETPDYRAIAFDKRSGELRAETRERRKKTFTTIFAGILAILAIIFITHTLLPERVEVDPWDYAIFDLSGMSGHGTLKILLASTEDVPANSIQYSASHTRDLSNGDIVQVSARSSMFTLTSTTETFLVEGLQTYNIDLNALTDAQLDTLQEKSLARVRNIGTGTNGQGQNMRRVRMYSKSSDSGNVVFDVYAADFALASGGYRTVYLVVYYENLVVNDGDDVSMRYFEQMYVGSSVSIGDWRDGVVTGYETLEDVDTALHMSMKQEETLSMRDFA